MDASSISLCIPVHNRTYDLKKTLPHLLETTNYSSAEIVILDYNSPDDLEEWIKPHLSNVTYRKYSGANYYHMAHARNLSVLAASGKYVSILSADIYPTVNYVELLKEQLENYDWMCGEHAGLVVVNKEEFIKAGGYDERFEFYGPEDKDLAERLTRRNLRFGRLPRGLFTIIETPNVEKIKNYRLSLSKKEMADRMSRIYFDNIKNNILVANPNGWGSWK